MRTSQPFPRPPIAAVVGRGPSSSLTRVLAAPLFLLPFGRPRGLLGVGTSLGSFCKDRWGSQGHRSHLPHPFQNRALCPSPGELSLQAIPQLWNPQESWQAALGIQVLRLNIFYEVSPLASL